MGKMSTKAQVGLELVTSVGIILLILALMTIYSIEKTQDSNDMKSFLDAKRICTSISDNLDMIQEQGEGYYKYFSIPEKVYGNYDYNVSMGNNVVEISWGGKAWTVNTIASNVTVYCLDYGLNETNRVFSKGDHLAVTCNRPNVMPVENSLRYWVSDGNVTISLKVENDAQINSPAFNLSIDGARKELGQMDAYEKVDVNHTIENFPAGGYTVIIRADLDGVVEESIESDNTVNVTITI